MAPTELAEAIESATMAESRGLLRGIDAKTSIGQECFEHLVRLLERSPTLAGEYAKKLSILKRRRIDQGWGHRVEAVSQFLAGNFARAAREFQQAGTHSADPALRAEMSIGAVDALARAGDFEGALAFGKRLLTIARRYKRTDLEGKICINLGNACLMVDQYEHARKWYTSALQCSASLPAEDVARIQLGCSTSHLVGGDLEQCLSLAETAANHFSSVGKTYFAQQAKVNIAQSKALLGEIDSAQDMFEQLLAELPEGDRSVALIQEYLGDIYVDISMLDAAQSRYDAALEWHENDASLNRANCLLGLARIRFNSGELSQAETLGRAALKLYNKLDNASLATQATILIAEIFSHSGRASRAITLLDEAIATLQKLGANYYLARASIIKLRISFDPALARKAERLISQSGYVDLLWEVLACRAGAKTGKKQIEAYERMTEAIFAAQLLKFNALSYSSSLVNKQSDLNNYLEILIQSGDLDKVLDVLQKTRSVALVSEVLQGNRTVLTDEKQRQLEELRTEFAKIQSDTGPGNARRATESTAKISVLTQKWTEFSRDILSTQFQPVQSIPEGWGAIISTSQRHHLLVDGRLNEIPGSPLLLEQESKWLAFDLCAPQMDPNSSHTALDNYLNGPLGEAWRFVDSFNLRGLILDGTSWLIPWNLLAQMSGKGDMILSPFFNVSEKSPEITPQKVVIWHHSTPDLPYIKDEVDRLQLVFPHAVLCESLDQVRQSMEMGPIDLLHIAGHASLNVNHPAFSYVHFSDGNLRAFEIMGSELQVETVVLSACDSGRMSLVNLFEPDGITRSFLAKGTKHVLSAMWALDDRAGSQFMNSFYGKYLHKTNLVQAVNNAKLDVRNDFAHPYYWGAMSVFGGMKS